MSFKISEKVVCVDDQNWTKENKTPQGYPIKGKVYVVRDTRINMRQLGLMLVGLVTYGISGEEVGFRASRFRRLEEIQAENKLKKSQKQPA